MKALVLTAGEGQRLRPLTSNRSKSMLMIAGRPVIQYIIDSLVENGINDIVMVVGHGREELMDYFQTGDDQGVKIKYVIQHKQVGAEDAILTAREELEDQEEFLLVNGDVLIEPDMVKRTLNNHETTDGFVTLLVTLVSNPEQFGTVKIGSDGVVEKLVEKGGPDRYVSNYAVAGVSVFNKETFALLETHQKMEKMFEELIDGGKKVTATVWEKEWAEFTWPWDILNANRIVMDRKLRGKGSFIAESAEIHPTVIIEGSVHIDEGAIIRPNTTICGPVYIGKRVYVGNNSLIRDYSSLCEGCKIGYAVEMRNSMVFERVNIGRMTYLADSIIGADTCIEAGAQLWNWRPGNEPLFLESKDERVQIPSRKFGVIIGDNVVIGVNTSIYPATRVGENTTISAGCVITKDIEPDKDVCLEQNLKIKEKKEKNS